MFQLLLNKLFPARKATHRKTARRKVARRTTPTRLGLNALDDRSLPSVTASVSPAGVLAITGSGGNDAVTLFGMPGFPNISVISSSQVGTTTTSKVFDIPRTSVRSITFNGGAGNDLLMGAFLSDGVPFTSIDGGPGNDTLIGGTGNDVFVGSPGIDRFRGAGGNDQLLRNGYRGFFEDNGNTGAGDDVTIGMVDGPLSYRELTAPGKKLFARPVPLSTTDIELYGPSGAGFILRADSWTVTNRPSLGGTEYKANGPVTLVTGRSQNLPLPSSLFQSFLIGYSTGGATHRAGPVLSNLAFNTSDLLGPLTDEIEAKTGMTVTLPGLSGGLALGSRLGFTDLPVASAVPYLYGHVGSTAGVSIGNMGMDAPLPTNGWGVSVAVDPTDIGGMALLKTPVVEVGFGWSQNGEIPYVPTSIPDDKSDPQVAGNLYLYASGQLGSLPVSLAGTTIIDVDANGDGTFAGLTPQTIGQIARGQAGLNTVAGIMNDVKIGFNGEVSVSLPITKTLDLDLKVGEGSVYWAPGANGQPGVAAFRASSTNPFAGTPLSMFGGGGSFDFQGWFGTNGDFRVAATSTPMDYHYSIAGIDLFQMKQTFGVEISKIGSVVSLSGSYYASVTIGDMRFLGVHAEISANLAFSVNTSTGRISISGSGRMSGEVCVFGIKGGLSVGLAFDNHGVYVDMPGGDALDFDINW